MYKNKSSIKTECELNFRPGTLPSHVRSSSGCIFSFSNTQRAQKVIYRAELLICRGQHHRNSGPVAPKRGPESSSSKSRRRVSRWHRDGDRKSRQTTAARAGSLSCPMHIKSLAEASEEGLEQVRKKERKTERNKHKPEGIFWVPDCETIK